MKKIGEEIIQLLSVHYLKKTFIASRMLHKNGRKCTNCGKSTEYYKGDENSGASATIEW